MKKTALIVVTLSLCTALYAQSFSVEYIDGYLDVLDGGVWKELNIGDSLERTDIVRLDRDSSAELRGKKTVLTLANEGTYRIIELVSAQGQKEELGLVDLVGDRLSLLINDRESVQQSSAGGVRAAEGEFDDFSEWEGSDTGKLIAASFESVDEGRFDVAITYLVEAFDSAVNDAEASEALFFRGYVYYLMGEPARALKFLTTQSPDVYSRVYHDHFLLAGTIMLDSFAYQRGEEWFTLYSPGRAASASPDVEQSIYLVAGVNSKLGGDVEDARRWFKKAYSVNPESSVAEKAREQLLSL